MKTILSSLLRFLAVASANLVGCQMAMGATIIATSPNLGDVSNAVSVASIGDIVRIPPGRVAWTNYLLIRKGISLLGAGTNATYITNAVKKFSPYSSGVPLIVCALTNDNPVTIGGIYIYGNWTAGGSGILIDNNRSLWTGPAPGVSSYRVFNCVFDQCYPRAFKSAGACYGVVDNCLFLDCYVGHSVDGENSKEWAKFPPPLFAMGTTNTHVIESCEFRYTRDLGTSPVPADCGDGGHYVFRFNKINNTQTAHYIDGLDAHGNNRMLSYEDKRGTIFVEIYGNVVNNNRGLKMAKLRGGTCMVYSNVFNVTANYAFNIQLDEEETWANYVYDQPLQRPLMVRTQPPAQDQITNTFVWANIRNGSSLTSEPAFYGADPNYNPITAGTTANPIALCLMEGVDFWKQSPWVPGYTNRSGAANAMLGYRPLEYPHPRVRNASPDQVIGVFIEGQ